MQERDFINYDWHTSYTFKIALLLKVFFAYENNVCDFG